MRITMQVIQKEDNYWWINTGSGFFGPFETNAAAWRWWERKEGDAVSPSEARQEWSIDQYLNRS